MTSRLATVLAVVILIGAGLYLSFELGRYRAGYSLLDERRQVEAYADAFEERNRTINELQRQLAILETSREIDRETYSSVEANLAELQSRIQAQEEELVFYRGIVSPGDGVAGLRIQTVEVDSGDGAASHMLRILLVQAIVHNDRVTGSVRVSVSGTLDAEEVAYGLDEVGAEDSGTDIPYGFRYFQTLELGLRLPEGFLPLAVEIQVWPRTPRGETIVQSFPWAAISG